MLSNYWCTDPPNIIVQTVKHINPRENTTKEISCEVKVDDYITYVSMEERFCSITNKKGAHLC